jgi:hypothetical protein
MYMQRMTQGDSMRESDCIYFARRAAEERAAAERSSHSIVRETHLDLAERYEKAAAAAELLPAVKLAS